MVRSYQLYRSFSIQLKFTHGQKIRFDIGTGHMQSLHFKNRTEKNERIKVENFQFPWRILEKKQLLSTGAGKKKNQRTPSRACPPSSHPL